MAEELKPGPTGDFPKGKMDQEDEGGLNIGVGSRGRKVMMVFGKTVAWIGMEADDAEKVADAIRVAASEARAFVEQAGKLKVVNNGKGNGDGRSDEEAGG